MVPRRALRPGLACIIAVSALALAAPPSRAACGGLLQPPCPPAPDPGGQETPNQPVPTSGTTFGFNSNLTVAVAATPTQELDAVEKAGGRYLRLGLWWRWLQPKADDPPLPASAPGNTVGRLDLLYSEARGRGINLILIPYGAPLWATRYATCALLDAACLQGQQAYNAGHKLFPDAVHFVDYREFVYAVKSRWPEAIIEPWNEPNLYYSQEPWVVSPADFAAIQCAAQQESRKVNSDPVLAAGWADAGPWENWLAGVYEAGGKDCWDRANMHIYFGSQIIFGANTNLARTMRGVRGLRSTYGDSDPLWVTETGYTTTGSFAVTEVDQADALRRLYNRFVTMGDVAAVLVHTTRDNQTGTESSGSSSYGYGLLRDNWSPKPAYCYFAAASDHTWPNCT